MKRKRILLVVILLVTIVNNTIAASSRDDLMQAINAGDFPLAVRLLNNTTWQYEENDENVLDWDRYTQFFSYCVSNSIGKDTMDIVSNYVVQLSIQIGNLHKTGGNLDKAKQWFYSAVDLSESLSMPKYAKQKSISYNQLGNFYQEKQLSTTWQFIAMSWRTPFGVQTMYLRMICIG